MSSKRYSPEIRKIAYEAIQKGERLTDISERIGVGIATLSDWKRTGELPSDFGRAMPTFRSKQKVVPEKSNKKIYQELFDRLPSNNQVFAEHLRRQYRDGLSFAINYAKIILSRIPSDTKLRINN